MNILLISYLFPPVGGPQSLRWLQFAKYLARNNFMVDVITINPGLGFSICYDRNFCKKELKGINVYRTYPGLIHRMQYRCPAPAITVQNTASLQSFRDKLIAQFKCFYKKTVKQLVIPDKTIEWIPWGMWEIIKLTRMNRYDLAISSAMPFTDHILGYFLKKLKNIPLILDYGDPWVFHPYFPKWRYNLDSRIEGAILREADGIVVTTEEAIKGFVKNYPFLRREKFSVIYQGYDKNMYNNIQFEKSSIFRIVYTGGFYDGIREPYVFFDAVSRLSDLRMEVVLVGNINSQYLKAIKIMGLEEKILFWGNQPHEIAISLQKSADLLLFLSNNSPYQLSGKIFEYFGASRPILGIQFVEDDPAVSLIRKNNRGFVAPNNAKEIASAIRQAYNLWEKGELQRQFNLSPMEEYLWETQACKMKALIEDLVTTGGR